MNNATTFDPVKPGAWWWRLMPAAGSSRVARRRPVRASERAQQEVTAASAPSPEFDLLRRLREAGL